MTWKRPKQEQVSSFLDDSTRSTFSTGRQVTCGVTWTVSRVLSIEMVAVLLFAHVHALAEVHGPCMGCRLFNEQHRRYPDKDKKENEFCHYPCQCQEELACQDGVSVIKDGCSCCYMCARQMGDMCSVKDLCDTAKGLYCDSQDRHSAGICRGKDKNPCIVNEVEYMDGEKFQPECSQLCTCQNGFYGCVNTCPQELQKPSELTCHEPKLIEVKNKCCKEWTCQKMEAAGSSVLSSNGLKSDNLVLHNPIWHFTSTFSHMQETTSLATVLYQPCYKKTTDWTPCSVTCDVGVSIRIVVDPMTCNNYQELKLCYLRPCGMLAGTNGHEKCTPTTRRQHRYRIQYQDCLSVRDYRLKFCTICKKNKCCYPRRTSSRSMDFQCSDGKRETYNYMWIKKCQCDTTCKAHQKSTQHRSKAHQKSTKHRGKTHQQSTKHQGRGSRKGKKLKDYGSSLVRRFNI